MKGAFKTKNTLQEWLKIKGWTQRDLAAEIPCDETLISLILTGSRHPSWQMLRRLCFLTGLDVGDIIYFDRDAEQDDSEK